MSNDIILSVKGISKTFGGLKALVDVGFDIQRGEVYGIIGPNGSGKTTLINCITGFIKPLAGQVLFKGQDITGWPPHKIAHIGISRTFQIMRPYYSLAGIQEPYHSSLVTQGKNDRRMAWRWEARRQGYGSCRYSGRNWLRDVIPGFHTSSRLPCLPDIRKDLSLPDALL
ncbi:MAG: ATP-binding cassette domain-containing protein [Candidatus Moduliflexus flocculans]|nr:ATP-binding cassette domain-containing protein [Candidatus Moduliflexus flocculans]